MTKEPDSEIILRGEDLVHQQLRVLILIEAVSDVPGTSRKLDGLTKLAKLDFLARYQEFEEQVAIELGLPQYNAEPKSRDLGMTAAPMTKFRYGPWDDQYYPVIGALVGRGLIRYAPGKRGSVALAPTKLGQALTEKLKSDSLWMPVAVRYRAIADRFGSLTGNRLKEAIYSALPEKMDAELGTDIT